MFSLNRGIFDHIKKYDILNYAVYFLGTSLNIKYFTLTVKQVCTAVGIM